MQIASWATSAVAVAVSVLASLVLLVPQQLGNQIALGLPPSSSAQEFNADFAGIGFSDLLLYNRVQGTLKVLSLTDELLRLQKAHVPRFVINEILANQSNTSP